MKDIVMPKLSDTMTEGRLISWRKKVGDKVSRGDIIADVETDKANMELEAYATGVLLDIKVQPGEVAPVGTVIGTIGAAGEKGASAQQEQPGSARQPAAAPQPAAEAQQPAAEAPQAPRQQGAAPAAAPAPVQEERAAAQRGAGSLPQEAEPEVASGAPGEELATAVSGAPDKVPPPAEAAPSAHPAAQRPDASAARLRQETAPREERAAPVVRRRAREMGVELSSVKGSGPAGRILMQDLEKSQPPKEEKGEAAAAAPQRLQAEVKPLSRQRSAIARTVSESWRTIPHFSVAVEVQMDEADRLRHQAKDAGTAVSINDMVVKAAALALQSFPQLNASFAGDALRFAADVNICLAVSVPDGLVMPVLSGCQRLSLSAIAQATRSMVERARAGQLTEREMTGGTFSVSNLGMFGVDHFTAVIYPGQSAILAVGTMVDGVVAKGGVPAVAKCMTLTLSADHRVVDGAYAAEFLGELKEILEHPVRLLL